MKTVEISKAEGSRNGLLMWYYGIEGYIEKAVTSDDFLELAVRCGKLAAACGSVAVEIAKAGGVPLKPLTKANKRWVRNLK